MTIQTFVSYSWEFSVISRHYSLIDNFLNSHIYLSAWQCIKIVRRIYMLVTPGSERVKRPGVFLWLLLNGMLVHHRLPPSISSGFPDSVLVPIYTPGWRGALWEQSVLLKNTTQWPGKGFNPDLLIWSLTTRPPCLDLSINKFYLPIFPINNNYIKLYLRNVFNN